MDLVLIELGFERVKQDGIIGFVKNYKGFQLWIATHPQITIYVATIKIKSLEIGLPGYVDEQWLYEFHKDNCAHA